MNNAELPVPPIPFLILHIDMEPSVMSGLSGQTYPLMNVLMGVCLPVFNLSTVMRSNMHDCVVLQFQRAELGQRHGCL